MNQNSLLNERTAIWLQSSVWELIELSPNWRNKGRTVGEDKCRAMYVFYDVKRAASFLQEFASNPGDVPN